MGTIRSWQGETGMKRSKKVVGIVTISVVGLVLLVLTSRGSHYAADVTHHHHFKIDMPFDELRKIMVRSSACREIMNAGKHNELLSQKWNNKSFHLGQLSFSNPDWKVDASGELKVRFTDPYIGTAIAQFTQTVAIVPENINSLVKLNEPVEELLIYNVTTEMGSKGKESEIRQTLQLKIDTPAPWYARWYARSRVRASTRKILRAMEDHIVTAVNKHKGQY